MSNFLCPHCQQIIDDGSDGFTSDREIELEKKLEVAVQALEKYADAKTWDCCYKNQCAYVDGFEAAQALAKIKEIKE